MTYFTPTGGLPAQTELLTGRAIVTEAYTVIPKGVLRDIVTSSLPGFTGTRSWILARPIAGFSTTFSQLIVEIGPGGGAERPEREAGVEGVVFVTSGRLTPHARRAGATRWSRAATPTSPRATRGRSRTMATSSRASTGSARPTSRWRASPRHPSSRSDQDVAPVPMPGTDGAWATTRFVDPDDLAHDMHVNIVTFQPGGSIPFAETHVMEHGLFVLEGKGVYRLNDDWVEVEAGDFLWLRAFCPQACYAGGPGHFRYLLYKDVNRQIRLT